MANDRQLRPDEGEYRTEIATDEVAPESPTPGAGSQPWLLLGLVLLAVFVGILVYALVLPALQ